MRSISRVEAPRCLSDRSPKAAGSSTSGPMEIFWGNPMPGTATGRGPGKWGCIMISLRLALARREIAASRSYCGRTGPRLPLG